MSSGALRCASELFHPKVTEAAALLDASEVFPSGPFASEDVLGVLSRLGMRDQVTREAVLQSARSVEALAPVDAEAARDRGRALLRYVDVHAERLIVESPPEDETQTKRRWLPSVFQQAPSPRPSSPSGDPYPAAAFNRELAQLAWLPVQVQRSQLFLPWASESCASSVAAATSVRPSEELWLVSASCRLLDAEVRSDRLRQLMGWHRPPNAYILAAQLGALAQVTPPHDEVVGENVVERSVESAGQVVHGSSACTDDGVGTAELQKQYERSMTLAVPALYKALEHVLGGQQPEELSGYCDALLSALTEQPCVWTGGRFVTPSATALHSPLNLAPHLYTVPADLHCFGKLLLKLGVRSHFEAGQYLDMLERLAMAAGGSPQPLKTLQLTLAVVQHLAAPQHQPLPQQDVFVPDRTGTLVPSHELMYDDAPWLGDASLLPNSSAPMPMPAAAAQFRRIHLDVSHEVAERLGANSLRRWLIARNADTFALGQENIEAFGQHESLTRRACASRTIASVASVPASQDQP